MDFPEIFRVRQTFPRPRVENLSAEVHQQLSTCGLAQRVKPGQRIAVTVGSRGIANVATIIKSVIDSLQKCGAKPFIVPAMGSHGGGTAAGQRQVVEGYGITEDQLGCPILSSLDTVVVCQTPEGVPVHFDKHAYEADGVLVCGRIKPHTRFVGDIESGLMKMLLIGLGKQAGAIIYHRAIQTYSFDQIVRSVAAEVIDRCQVVAGLAIVENAYDETALLSGVAPDEFLSREIQLLQQAKQLMPKLPFERADVLIVDQIGKNISGTGMDTNIIGRKFNDHAAREDEWPKIHLIGVRSLTPQTHGNGTGIGIAEFAHRKAIDALDLEATRLNCLTASHPTGGMIPLTFETDRQWLQAALPMIGLTDPPHAKLMWIQDTRHLAEVECSAAYLEDARQRDDLQVLTDLRPLPFEKSGDLITPHS